MAQASQLRREVLKCLKSLHRARETVFKGDQRALTEGRKKINEEFKKYKHIENVESIQELINYSKAVEHELRTCVIQAREVAPRIYRAEITKDTIKLDNVPFQEECCNNLDGDRMPKKSGCS